MDEKELEPVVNADEHPAEQLLETVEAEPQAEIEAAIAVEVAAVEEAIEIVEMVEILEAVEPTAAPETAEPAQESLVVEMGDDELRAIVEAVVYVTEEPLSVEQIATALQQKKERIEATLARLIEDNNRPERGLIIKEVAGGYKMGTKPEHHDRIRQFVKNLKPALKLSMAALETLAVIAYKQPITAPEIMEVRGVQGAGVLKTLLDRKLIATGGRKNVVGKPILYKTTKDFLVQFGLNGLNELPTLKEFEELRRLALDDIEQGTEQPAAGAQIEAVAEQLAVEPPATEATETTQETQAENQPEEAATKAQITAIEEATDGTIH